MTRGDSKTIIVKNLENAGSVFYSDPELNDSIQDAYDDIALLTQFNVKSTTISQAAKNYYDFKNQHSISDYLSTIAIFNSLSNFWLRDDLAYRQLDRIRRDWENWRGNSAFWTPVNYQWVAIAPFNEVPTGNFTLKYAAIAPTLTADTDTYLIAADMADLIEYYVTADMLETAEEFTKAGVYWKLYFEHIAAYKERCHNIARADLQLRI